MKKGDILRLRIDSLRKLNVGEGTPIPDENYPCNNIVTEKPKVKLKNVIPGQEVLARITKKRKGQSEGQVIEVLKPAPGEVRAVCQVNENCGGCLFQSLEYENELKIKEDYLRNLFSAYPFSGLKPARHPRNYRNKMEYSFGDSEKGGPLTLGLHERNRFFNILSTDGCILPIKDLERIRKATEEYFRQLGEGYYHKNTHKGLLRYLVVRAGENTGEVSVNLVTSSQGSLDEEGFVEMLRGLELDGEITGILHTISDSVADAVIPEETRLLYGTENLHENLLGLNFEYTPFSFFQVNSAGAEDLYSVVRDYVSEALNGGKTGTIYDLYSGTGTIGMLLSDIADNVVGIELNEEAVEIAKVNAQKNGIENCEFIAGDVLKEAENLDFMTDVIVLDPPRSGIHPKAIKRILDLSPNAFVYVSCSPESLARDLPFFEQKGYKVKKMESVDMFPMTPHVETVVLLSQDKN